MKTKGKAACAAAAVLLLFAGAYTAAGASAGTTGDPLVTLSYLVEKFTPQMESEMQTLVDDRAAELTERFNAAVQGSGTAIGGTADSAVFHVVTLSRGQVLTGDVGCEVMLRVGGAVCSTDESTGLIDETAGSTLGDGGALVKNHLYMVTISTRSVVAGADTVKLLVRGPYTVA